MNTKESGYTINWAQLAKYLRQRSREICRDNGCDNDEHNCESYAYISKNGLMDICLPDYFQGSSKPYAMIPLPFNGFAIDLEEEVETQITDCELNTNYV